MAEISSHFKQAELELSEAFRSSHVMRRQMAMAALSGMCANGDAQFTETPATQIAKWAVEMADATLLELGKTPIPAIPEKP